MDRAISVNDEVVIDLIIYHNRKFFIVITRFRGLNYRITTRRDYTLSASLKRKEKRTKKRKEMKRKEKGNFESYCEKVNHLKVIQRVLDSFIKRFSALIPNKCLRGYLNRKIRIQ